MANTKRYLLRLSSSKNISTWNDIFILRLCCWSSWDKQRQAILKTGHQPWIYVPVYYCQQQQQQQHILSHIFPSIQTLFYSFIIVSLSLLGHWLSKQLSSTIVSHKWLNRPCSNESRLNLLDESLNSCIRSLRRFSLWRRSIASKSSLLLPMESPVSTSLLTSYWLPTQVVERELGVHRFVLVKVWVLVGVDVEAETETDKWVGSIIILVGNQLDSIGKYGWGGQSETSQVLVIHMQPFIRIIL